MSEMRLNRGPLTIENAVHASVAQDAVARDLMLSQYPIQFRTQALDGNATLLVEKVGSEFHRDATYLFERMGQKQQLAFGVQRAALHALSIPSRADFHAPIDRIDVHKRGHADRFIGGFFDDGKWNHRTLLLELQAPVNFRSQSIRCGNCGVSQVPQLAILQGLDEIVVMGVRKRNNRYLLPVQRDRRSKTHVVPSSGL
jgi:hypothetical protein